MDFYAGVGISQARDSRTAGREAAAQALKKAGINTANFLWVFADSHYDHQALLDGIKEVVNAPMVGGSTAGEISDQGTTENSVVVTAVASQTISLTPAINQNVSGNELKSGELLAKTASTSCPQPDQKKSLLIFSDGIQSEGIAIIQGLQNVLGENFEIVGGTLADGVNFKTTYQYFNGQVYQNSLVGVLVAGDVVTGVGLKTGWESVGNRLKCTKCSGRVVYQLDGQPALQIYKLYLGPERSAKLPEIAFEYPLGLMTQPTVPEGEQNFLLRTPITINETEQSLTFGSLIPENSYLSITVASRQNLIHQAEQAAQQAKESLTGARPLLILNFAGLGRKLVLGLRTKEEIAAIQEVLGESVPLAGFYSYGQIGPLDKNLPDLRSARFHNQATILWVLGTNLFQ